MYQRKNKIYDSSYKLSNNKIWKIFSIFKWTTIVALCTLLLISNVGNFMFEDTTVEAAITKEPFTISDQYTLDSAKVNFDVTGYLIDGSLSREDEVIIEIHNVPSGVTPPMLGILNFSKGAEDVWLKPTDPTVKHSGSDWTYTFTKEMIRNSGLFDAEGELTLSIGGYYDLAYNGKPIVAKPEKLKINYVDTSGNPLPNPPVLQEVSYEDLANLDALAPVAGYQLDLSQSKLTVPNTTDPNLKGKVDAYGSLSAGVKAILDDATYGGGGNSK